MTLGVASEWQSRFRGPEWINTGEPPWSPASSLSGCAALAVGHGWSSLPKDRRDAARQDGCVYCLVIGTQGQSAPKNLLLSFSLLGLDFWPPVLGYQWLGSCLSEHQAHLARAQGFASFPTPTSMQILTDLIPWTQNFLLLILATAFCGLSR